MKNAIYGFIIYERIGNNRCRHFRKSTAKRDDVAMARIHDLTRSSRWNGERVFEIWDGIIPKTLVTVKKDVNGKSVFSTKSYLLPVFVGEFETSKGEKVKINDKLGHEKDYRDAHRYERVITCGAKAGDLSSWIKSEKRLDKVPCNVVNKKNFVGSSRVTERTLY